MKARDFRELRLDTLEVNFNAPRYVVAQVDFDFIDQEATDILKQEAVRDIGKIYRLKEGQIKRKSKDF